MTQQETIEQLLLTRNWVSMVEFIQRYITRGGAIIYKMKKEGWVIESRIVEGKHYSEYKLMAKPNEEVKLFDIKSRF